jgi:uncharacterized protein YbjT (DUF2867 family)
MHSIDATNVVRGPTFGGSRRASAPDDRGEIDMYVVAGVTGKTGAVVASTLLEGGAKVRVIVRRAEQGEPWRGRGAEVAVARLEDAGELARALSSDGGERVEGAYLLLPPDYASTDNIGDKRRMTAAMRDAIERANVPHVVFLSSVGAQHEAGTGPIRIVAHAERELAKATATRFTWLRPAYFAENLGSVLAPARAEGVLPSTFDPTLRIPMVATTDIGRVAARALLEGPADGRASIVELEGPRRVSFDDLAGELGTLLGREVRTVHVPREAVAGALQQAGLGADLASLYAEMGRGIEDGLVDFEGRGARHVKGDVDARDVLRAMVA